VALPVVADGAQSPPKPAPTAKKPPSRASSNVKFDRLVTEAEEARKAAQLHAAVDLYRQALAIKPDWTEGWWDVGTVLYELDEFGEARDAFRRVLLKHNDNGTAWAFKGLCEFKLKNYDQALTDLLQARGFGVRGAREVQEVARYHTAILFTRNEQYDEALNVLTDFALERNDSPRTIEAMGIASLRMPMLPEEVPGARREVVMMAGRARYFMGARLMAAAQNAYEALVGRFPETPNVHYAFGVFLLTEQPEAAIEQFKRELKVSPGHVYAKLQIAFAHIRRGEYDAARPWAEESAKEAPTDFVARNALGQTLLELGDVEGAIRELEQGVKLAPDSPAMRFVLARAYRRAGRAADADREQAEFTRLDRLVRASKTGGESLGGIPIDNPGPRRN
jgi:tetratricopeptide (TPR) repeat protein